MKALVYSGPEDLRIIDAEDVTPAADEVKIKIKATGICGSDVHGYLGITGRRIPPMIMGHEFSGVVTEIGMAVKTVKVGDRITVQPVIFCGTCEMCRNGLTNICSNKTFYGVMNVNGSLAEYLCVPEKLVYSLPDSLNYIDGAMVEPLAVAYRAVKQAAPEMAGKTVLIVGAGTIGLLVLQVAKLMNPGKIIVSDVNDFRLEVAAKLGADYTVNPLKQDLKDFVESVATGPGGIDISIEAVGITATVQQALSVLKTHGTCIWIGNSQKMIEINMQEVVTRELKITGTYIYTHAEFGEAIELLTQGKINLNLLISEIVSLENAADAFNRLAHQPEKLIKIIVEN
jgi:2-desacetyl-2-hydroxyethyl bacteriochlorophyllide A dehydrogenase